VHPTVQDVFGLRMSKSLGTGIDPMGLIELTAPTQRVRPVATRDRRAGRALYRQAESALGETEGRRLIKEKKSLPLVWTKPAERYPQMQSARNSPTRSGTPRALCDQCGIIGSRSTSTSKRRNSTWPVRGF
jgi:valyl-tRNA synthetase